MKKFKLLAVTLVVVMASVLFACSYSPRIHTITFNSNGGGGADYTQQVAELVVTQLTENEFVHGQGAPFLGWNTQSNGSGDSYADRAEVALNKSLTLYAQWGTVPTPTTYQVTFNANTGSGSMSKLTLNEGVAGALTANAFTKTGYSFNGWNTSANGSGTAYAAGASITLSGNVTLYAQWKANTYTISYNAGDGDGTITDQDVNFDAPITLSDGTGFSRENYELIGWNTESDGSGDDYALGYEFENYNIDGDLELYAVWQEEGNQDIEKYEVHLNGNDNDSGEMGTLEVNEGESLTLPKNEYAREGYTFSGWNTEANGTGTAYADKATFTPTGDLTLYAQWTLIRTYTITFEGESVGFDSVTEDEGTEVEITAELIPDRTGYTFGGWLGSDSETYELNDVITLSQDLTLTAQWTANVYKVIYHINDGVNTTTHEDNVTFDSNYTVLDDDVFTREGFTLEYWNYNPDGTGQSRSFGEVVKYTNPANRNLYAVWQDNSVPAVEKYKVHFDGNDNDSGEMGFVQVEKEKSLTLPENEYTREGYTFSGWNTKADGTGTAYADKATFTPTEEITLYAQWTIIRTYTITFTGDGVSINSVTRYENTEFTFTSSYIPARTGYEFDGWLGDDGETYYEDDTFDFTSDLTLTAQWTANKYKVIYHINYGTNEDTFEDNVTFDSNYTVLGNNVFTRDGFKLIYWSYNSDGTGQKRNFGEVVHYQNPADRNLYAVWQALNEAELFAIMVADLANYSEITVKGDIIAALDEYKDAKAYYTSNISGDNDLEEEAAADIEYVEAGISALQAKLDAIIAGEYVSAVADLFVKHNDLTGLSEAQTAEALADFEAIKDDYDTLTPDQKAIEGAATAYDEVVAAIATLQNAIAEYDLADLNNRIVAALANPETTKAQLEALKAEYDGNTYTGDKQSFVPSYAALLNGIMDIEHYESNIFKVDFTVTQSGVVNDGDFFTYGGNRVTSGNISSHVATYKSDGVTITDYKGGLRMESAAHVSFTLSEPSIVTFSSSIGKGGNTMGVHQVGETTSLLQSFAFTAENTNEHIFTYTITAEQLEVSKNFTIKRINGEATLYWVEVEPAIKKSVAIANVKTLIDDIGVVEYTPEIANKITAAQKAYNALSYSDKETLVTNLSTLQAAVSTFNAAGVVYVKGLIDAIDDIIVYNPEGADDSLAGITAAQSAYNAFGYADKETEITNHGNIATALEDYINAGIVFVGGKITAIGTVTPDSGTAITEARNAYNNATLQAIKDGVNVTLLQQSEKAYAVVMLIDAIGQVVYAPVVEDPDGDPSEPDGTEDPSDPDGGDPVDPTPTAPVDSLEAIEAARSAYNNLTDDEKALVGNYSVLESAEKVYNVMDLIASIGEVAYTPASLALIEAARAAYNDLTDGEDGEQAAVTNYTTLTEAEAEYISLGKEAVEALIALLAGIEDADDIDDGTFTLINAARLAYDNAIQAVKDAVTNLGILEAAEVAFEQAAIQIFTDMVDELADPETLTEKGDIIAALTAYNAAKDVYEALTQEQKADANVITAYDKVTAGITALQDKLDIILANEWKASVANAIVTLTGDEDDTALQSKLSDYNALLTAYGNLTPAQKVVEGVDTAHAQLTTAIAGVNDAIAYLPAKAFIANVDKLYTDYNNLTGLSKEQITAALAEVATLEADFAALGALKTDGAVAAAKTKLNSAKDLLDEANTLYKLQDDIEKILKKIAGDEETDGVFVFADELEALKAIYDNSEDSAKATIVKSYADLLVAINNAKMDAAYMASKTHYARINYDASSTEVSSSAIFTAYSTSTRTSNLAPGKSKALQLTSSGFVTFVITKASYVKMSVSQQSANDNRSFGVYKGGETSTTLISPEYKLQNLGKIEEIFAIVLPAGEYTVKRVQSNQLELYYIEIYEAAQISPAVNAVITAIAAIGTIEYTTESLNKITAAQNAYDALLAAAGEFDVDTYITNLSTLTGAMDAYYIAGAAGVEALIDAIGEIKYNQDSLEKIEAAQSAYNTLKTAAGAFNVDPYITNLSILTGAMDAYYIAGAAGVEALITEIGTIEYTAESLGKINAAQTAYDNLVEAAGEFDVDEHIDNLATLTGAMADYYAAGVVYVEGLIDAIGTVIYNPEQPDDSQAAINAAQAAYDAFTYAEKATEVDNYYKIAEAQAKYNSLKAIANVIALIDDIPVSIAGNTAIEEARAAYDVLTEGEQADVTNYDMLQQAEDVYAIVVLIGELGEAVYTPEFLKALSDIERAILALDEDDEEAAKDIAEERVSNYTTFTEKAEEYINLGVNHITGLINAIGGVTADSFPAIDEARKAFDAAIDPIQFALQEEEGGESSVYDTLLAAEAAFATFAVGVFKDMVSLLDSTVESKADVLEALNAHRLAEAAYNALTPEQKEDAEVSEAYDTVTAGIATLQGRLDIILANEWIAASPITSLEGQDLEELQALLAGYNDMLTAYDSLSDEQKAIAQTHKEAIEAAIAGVNAAIDVEIANLWIDASTITTLEGTEDLATLQTLLTGYNAMLTAYDNLSEEQKDVAAAQTRKGEIEAAIAEVNTAIAQLWIDASDITPLTGAEDLEALQTLLDDYNAMLTAYDNLSEAQKAVAVAQTHKDDIDTAITGVNTAIAYLPAKAFIAAVSSLLSTYDYATGLDATTTNEAIDAFEALLSGQYAALGALQSDSAVATAKASVDTALTALNAAADIYDLISRIQTELGKESPDLETLKDLEAECDELDSTDLAKITNYDDLVDKIADLEAAAASWLLTADNNGKEQTHSSGASVKITATGTSTDRGKIVVNGVTYGESGTLKTSFKFSSNALQVTGGSTAVKLTVYFAYEKATPSSSASVKITDITGGGSTSVATGQKIYQEIKNESNSTIYWIFEYIVPANKTYILEKDSTETSFYCATLEPVLS